MRIEFSPSPSKLVAKLTIEKQRGALNFKQLSNDGGQTKFAENLRASPFNKELSNENTFSLINLYLS
jgi:hypothetical protein